jgi:hypothetical protein
MNKISRNQSKIAKSNIFEKKNFSQKIKFLAQSETIKLSKARFLIYFHPLLSKNMRTLSKFLLKIVDLL